MRQAAYLARRLRRSAFARDAGTLTLGGGVVAIVTAVQGMFAARWLGPAGYGALALVVAFPALVLAILSPDSQHATVRYLADRDAEQDSLGAAAVCKLALLADLIVGAAAFGVVVASAGWAHHHVVRFDGSAALIVVAGAGILISVPVKVSTSILMHAGRFGWLAGEQVLSAVLRSTLIAVLVVSGYGVAGAVWGATIGLALHSVTLGFLATRETRRRWGSSWRVARLREHKALRAEMVRFLAWSDLGSFLGAIPKQLDVVLLGFLVGSRDVGFYRLAWSIAALPNYLVGPLQSATFPRMARISAERSREAMSAALRRHGVLACVLAAGGLVGVIVVPFVVHTLIGDAYGPTINMCRVLLAGSAVYLCCYWLRPLYMALGHIREWTALGAVTSLGALALFVPAVKVWGVMGMAIVQGTIIIGGHAFALVRVGSIVGQLVPSPAAQPGDMSETGASEVAEASGVPVGASAGRSSWRVGC
jgi:O-antigen/teichoic acid export membrane protein